MSDSSVSETLTLPYEAPYLQKPLSLIDTAFTLYGFIPEDSDDRWLFLAQYDSIKRETGFRPMNFDNAWGATYLSDEPSYRSGYVTTSNAENDLQLQRALDNLSYMSRVAQRYSASGKMYEDVDMRFALTDRLTTDPTQPKQEVTPCPEALYQIRVYDRNRYLARVGFNIHDEVSGAVLSIVNIQGTPGGMPRNAAFEKVNGVSPFNLLVRRVLSLSGAEEPSYEVRGLINPERGNAQLYWGVLENEGVEMYKAQRKPTAAIEVGSIPLL